MLLGKTLHSFLSQPFARHHLLERTITDLYGMIFLESTKLKPVKTDGT